ncbi:glycerophosphodiester phosphodiesterase [Chitinibacter bivalviorum]|uniref:Glycerophosphodiester phosphodiesterase n=1 Tax=Chitinibacter bivalviorum TaxID=2739434 RepID=A0A7H9BF28_9NEIS|nr:glycerophosphodiester phosphodiesterase [Chitinibacter bivalviorum]QLG87310.1 glycerophosphodiester phosphodiesterase [Chitinibacter bivalviorum]
MHLIAHRGLHHQHPENTIAAFAAAKTIGFHGFETDVRIDLNHTAILFHDRVAKNGVAVQQLSREALSQIQGYEVPTLAEALLAFPDAYWNIELKSRDCLAEAMRVLQALPQLANALISSFHHPLALAASQQSAYDCALLLAHTPHSLAFLERLRQDARQLNHLVLDYEICHPELIEQCTQLGFKIWIYGASNHAEHQQLITWGIDGVISDHPQHLGLSV